MAFNSHCSLTVNLGNKIKSGAILSFGDRLETETHRSGAVVSPHLIPPLVTGNALINPML